MRRRKMSKNSTKCEEELISTDFTFSDNSPSHVCFKLTFTTISEFSNGF